MVFYFVQRGETLYAIAKRYQTTVHAIVAANRLEDPNAICPGQALIIPRPGEVPSPPPGGIVHLVRPGETVFHLATKFATSPHNILRANQIAHPEFILPGQQLVIPERIDPGEDWPMFGRTPGRAGASPIVLKGTPAEGWSYSPRKNAGVKPSAPVMRYDRVFVGLGDGQYYALDSATGRVKWRVPVSTESAVRLGEHGLAAPVVFDGLVYLCGPDGQIYAVDAHSGQHVWKVGVGGSITSSPAVAEGIVYVGCWDEHVYAVEAKTGAIAWKRHVGAPVVLPVAVGDDLLFAVAANGELWAIDGQTGEVSWRTQCDAGQAPVFAEVILLAGGRAFDPRTGQELWHVDAGGTLPVVRLDQVIYPGGAVDLFTGGLRKAARAVGPAGEEPADKRAEPAATGQAEGTVIPPPPVPVSSLAAAAALLVGAGADQRLYGWNGETGEVEWTVELEAPALQAPAVIPGHVLLTLSDGSVRSYRFQTAK